MTSLSQLVSELKLDHQGLVTLSKYPPYGNAFSQPIGVTTGWIRMDGHNFMLGNDKGVFLSICPFPRLSTADVSYGTPRKSEKVQLTLGSNFVKAWRNPRKVKKGSVAVEEKGPVTILELRLSQAALPEIDAGELVLEFFDETWVNRVTDMTFIKKANQGANRSKLMA